MDYRAPSRLPVDLPYYHGPLSKKDCETLLLEDGIDGNFLIRDSESMPGVLCLCVSFKNFVYTYRIFKDRRGFYNIQTVEGAPKMLFSNLKELISTFEKPNQGLVVQLGHPVKQASSCPRWRRSQIQLDSIYVKNFNEELINMECSKFYANSFTRLQTIVIHFTLLDLSSKVIKERNSKFPDNMNRHCGWRPKVGAILSSWATEIQADIAKTALPSEASSPAQALPAQYHSSAFRLGVQNPGFSPDCILRDPKNGEQLRRNCTIYRPWFSPYSYFVCTDQESHLEAYSFPEVQRDEGRGDSCLPEDLAESICSSSSSPENTCPREASKKSRHGLDSTDYITSQDILTASRWHPAQQSGYKCAACCRMYPTLHSLKSHIKGGFREGFSCRVYYRKLKTLWGKEQKARPGDRLSSGNCQAFK